ncbi:MKRN2 opposite strand protein [Tetranychus urticae]|nr:MKRN2 opposite strand protein [Tetranychus urticae]
MTSISLNNDGNHHHHHYHQNSFHLQQIQNQQSITNQNPNILCFQHCDTRCKIFSFKLPDRCPLCSTQLTPNTQLILPPFQVPFPLTSHKRITTSIIIRPTEGDFLHNYQNSADLHIGLTDSKGDVYEYDKNGVHIGSQNLLWIDCLAIPVIDPVSQSWKDYWDSTLKVLVQMPIWTADNYTQDDNNCYTFVLTFLRLLKIKQLRPSLASKTQFCKDFIIPRTKVAAKYIALYRQIRRDSIAVVKTQGT